MSLFGALFSGVSGLQSQSSAMGAIADNVTNVNTIGYKATTVNFKTLITAQTSLTQYSPGGVQSSPRQGVDIQGLLQATTSSTDVGVSGAGFFVTNAVANAGPNDLFTYTRAGSYKVDREGFLQNVGGGYMQGWPLGQNDPNVSSAKRVTVGKDIFMKSYTNGAGDTVIINDNVIDNTNLRPLNLQTIGGTAASTTTLSIGANLPAAASINQQQRVNAQIFDSLGNPANLSYNFAKIGQNQWAATVEQPAKTAVAVQHTQQSDEVYFSSGRIDFTDTLQAPIQGQFNFQVNGASFSVLFDNATSGSSTVGSGTVNTNSRTLTQVIGDLAAEVNNQMTAAYGAVTAPQPQGNWCRQVSGANAIIFDQASATQDMHFEVDSANPVVDANSKPIVFQNLPGGFSVPHLGDNLNDASHAWYDLTGTLPLSAPTGVAQRGVAAVEFAGNGTPAFLYGRDGAAAPSPRTTLDLTWADGAADMGTSNATPSGAATGATVPAISVFLGNYSVPDGLTQLSGDYQLSYLQQDGSKFGNFAGVSIGSDGIVTALFDNGVTRPVFMIPLASFTNPNGLSSLSGNSWIATDFSGNPTLRQAGDAGAGQINSATLEASTVDLGTEFTRMITTQRAYSSAAKVITTADDMLNELLNIKR